MKKIIIWFAKKFNVNLTKEVTIYKPIDNTINDNVYIDGNLTVSGTVTVTGNITCHSIKTNQN